MLKAESGFWKGAPRTSPFRELFLHFPCYGISISRSLLIPHVGLVSCSVRFCEDHDLIPLLTSQDKCHKSFWVLFWRCEINP